MSEQHPTWREWSELKDDLFDIKAIAIGALVVAGFLALLVIVGLLTIRDIDKTLKARSACTDCACAMGICQCKVCDSDVVEGSK